MIRFLKDKKGAVLLMFALGLPVSLGAMSVAIDYTLANSLRSKMQATVDSAALSAAGAIDTRSIQTIVSGAQSRLTDQRVLGQNASDVSMSGQWITPTDFRLTASATFSNSFSKAVPGMPSSVRVRAEAIARFHEPILMGAPPSVTTLDPEAADYNQIAVYCFNPLQRTAANKGRTQHTYIADNGGTTYRNPIPTCGEGETISYMLRNVRNMRTTPNKWNDPRVEQYYYYTDTVMDGYQQVSTSLDVPILETVFCPSLSVCKPQSQRGILPEGKNRNPQTATQECLPGQYMYYGWEDRPPGRGWTDADYDDIRLIVECPTILKGAREVRLIK